MQRWLHALRTLRLRQFLETSVKSGIENYEYKIRCWPLGSGKVRESGFSFITFWVDLPVGSRRREV